MTKVLCREPELIEVAQGLPAAARLLVELGQLIRNPAAETRDVTAVLRRDPALVSRLIRLANGSVYARAEPASSLEEAVACIGFAEVHRLVGALASAQQAEIKLSCYGTDPVRARHNALFTALIMEQLAGLADEDPRAAYTIGLLRTIGRMVLDQLATRFIGVVEFDPARWPAIHAWEQEHWELTSAEASEKILIHWRLPAETALAIRHHGLPANRHNPMIHLLNLAAGAADHRGYGLPGEEAYWRFLPENFTKAGVDPKQFQRAAESADRAFHRLVSATG
jgi:HD-like signal output (HDOD) protein